MDLNFRMVHQNFNVADLDTSLDFYEKALGLTEKSRIDGDGFTIVYVGNDTTDFVLELTCLDDHPEKYDLGEGEFHLAFKVQDFDTKKWVASALKTLIWVFTLSMTLTVIGWKLSLKLKNFNSLLEYLFKGVHCTPFLL